MKVNDVVFYVPSNKGLDSGKLVDVVKIGRKYFYIRLGFNDLKCVENKYNSNSLGRVDEYPYGEIYETQQDYLDFLEWKDFVLNVPATLTKEQKYKILKIVKGEL